MANKETKDEDVVAEEGLDEEKAEQEQRGKIGGKEKRKQREEDCEKPQNEVGCRRIGNWWNHIYDDKVEMEADDDIEDAHVDGAPAIVGALESMVLAGGNKKQQTMKKHAQHTMRRPAGNMTKRPAAAPMCKQVAVSSAKMKCLADIEHITYKYKGGKVYVSLSHLPAIG